MSYPILVKLHQDWLWLETVKTEKCLHYKKDGTRNGYYTRIGIRRFLFMIYHIQRKIVKVQAEMKAYNNIKQYTHYFGDFIFYISMNFRSSYLENLAKERNEALNTEAKTKAAEYFLEVMILQCNTLLFNCERNTWNSSILLYTMSLLFHWLMAKHSTNTWSF